ncbi:MAG TPA: GntR family transcriptional regulator [Armatimonadota bacterium]|nr:GntR family transcriptional regulator [Armatimonadota bacterium]HOS42257.1 GntR family transcriptional regulator [Armatimonadota bacterium]
MRFQVDPTSSIPLYAQLVEQVKHAIAAGTLAPGDTLPSLRELAVRLRISPLTVKKAYGELEALGIVATEHGRGTTVRAGSDAFSARYRREALAQAVDRLLVEAHHLGATTDELIALLYERKTVLEEEAADHV